MTPVMEEVRLTARQLRGWQLATFMSRVGMHHLDCNQVIDVSSLVPEAWMASMRLPLSDLAGVIHEHQCPADGDGPAAR